MPSPIKVPGWVHMLDELAHWPDQIAWYDPAGLRMSPFDQQMAIVSLVKDGLAVPAGYRVRETIEDLYAITPKGAQVWEESVRGSRVRSKKANQAPKWSTAQLAVAYGPRDVWDLARVPWRWNKQAEIDARLGQKLKPKVRW